MTVEKIKININEILSLLYEYFLDKDETGIKEEINSVDKTQTDPERERSINPRNLMDILKERCRR